jgi:hypothetical protein
MSETVMVSELVTGLNRDATAPFTKEEVGAQHGNIQ